MPPPYFVSLSGACVVGVQYFSRSPLHNNIKLAGDEGALKGFIPTVGKRRQRQLETSGINMNPSSSSNGGGSRYYNIGNTLELFLSLGYGMMGWYLPRHFMFLAWPSIVQKDISEVYQLVGGSNGNNQVVVVDFLLNHPLVDPPTVPST